jgi:MFS family permease
MRMLRTDRTLRTWLVASRLGGSTDATAPLALLLAGQAATGSLATGVLMSGVFQVVMAAAAPWRGRHLDSRRLPAAFRSPLLYQAAAAGWLALAAAAHSPPPVLVGLAAALGLAAAGLDGGYRAMLPSCLPPETLPAAYAIDAAAQEGEWLLGPTIVGLVALLASPPAALLVIAVATLAAAVASRSLPTRPPAPPEQQRRRVAPWRVRAARDVLTFSAAFGVTWGVISAGGPALLEDLGSPAALWGPLTIVPVLASMVGGLAYARIGEHRWIRHEPTRALVLFGLWCVGMVALLGAVSLPVLFILLTLLGFPYAPLEGILRNLLSKALPAHVHAEGFALESAVFGVGSGAGAAVLAALLRHLGPAQAMAGAAAAMFVVALGVVTIPRRSQPPASPAEPTADAPPTDLPGAGPTGSGDPSTATPPA